MVLEKVLEKVLKMVLETVLEMVLEMADCRIRLDARQKPTLLLRRPSFIAPEIKVASCPFMHFQIKMYWNQILSPTIGG